MLKKILLFGLAFVVIIISTLVIYLAYSGLFHKVVMEEKEIGSFVLIYENHVGEYQKIKPVMDKVYNSLLNEDKIETTRGFGIYYDNPKKVAKDKLRSIGGCILDEKDYAKLEQLKTKYKVMELPKKKSLYAEFPFNNPISIFIGILKVYPVFSAYIKTKQYQQREVMEVYNQGAKKIEYIMPLE